jgi:hypothetical protein
VSDRAFDYTVELTRGGDTNNRDKQKVKVSADSVDELREKVDAVKEQLNDWALDLRDIQPSTHSRVTEDQQELGEVDA